MPQHNLPAQLTALVGRTGELKGIGDVHMLVAGDLTGAPQPA